MRGYRQRVRKSCYLSYVIEIFSALPPDEPRLVGLCSRAYGEPFAPILRELALVGHAIAILDGEWVAHAGWAVRELHAGARVLRTAYVEAVATEPRHQRRGFASAVMRALPDALAGFELAALSPSDPAFYERFGWQLWRGPLAIRGTGPTPDEQVMILALPRTPPLDLDGSLSAEWRPGELW